VGLQVVLIAPFAWKGHHEPGAYGKAELLRPGTGQLSISLRDDLVPEVKRAIGFRKDCPKTGKDYRPAGDYICGMPEIGW
jgi:hypothetical protein